MDGSGTHVLMPKWGRLRKKPQPLTDLTNLYSKIANETIYYLKLEERHEYDRAMQGWKGLNTEVLYQLTVLDHTYPNIKTYSKDELSLRNGVRELYHKASDHMERVRQLCVSKNHEKRSSLTNGSHRHDEYTSPRNSFTANNSNLLSKKHEYSGQLKGQQHHISNMARTFKNPRDLYSKYPHNRSPNVKPVKTLNKTNVIISKPLEASKITADHRYSNKPVVETLHLKNIDEHVNLIDLTSDSDESFMEDGAESRKSSGQSFELDEYYNTYLDTNDSDYNKTSSLENLKCGTIPFSDLSLSSTPLKPVVNEKLEKASSIAAIKSLAPLKKTNSDCGNTATTKTSVAKNHHLSLSNIKATKSNPTLSAPTSKTKHAVYKSSSSEALPKKLGAISTPPVKQSLVSLKQKVDSTRSIQNTTAQSSATSHSRPKLASRVSHKKKPSKLEKDSRPKTTKTVKTVKRASKDGVIATGSKSSRPSSVKIISKTKHSSSPVLPPVPTLPKLPPPTPSQSPNLPITSESTPSETLLMNEQDVSAELEDIRKTKEMLEDEIIDSLVGIDKTAAKQIFSEIVVNGDQVHWSDVAGLETAKTSLKEAVVYPFLRPDLFKGLREPVRGMLLFGPPGTGKTMLARAVATESNSTFFSISASSLTSKYLGESEKLVRALFAVAKKLSPSIIFVDEIDSIMGSRDNEGENESSRRIKNEFLVQWSSLSNAAAGSERDVVDDRVLLLAATNLPWGIDEAARRRFVRRQYIPLPERYTRLVQLKKLLEKQKHTLTEDDFELLLDLTDGYSGSDITSLAKDAAMGPLRELGEKLLETPRDQIRAININDFKNSLVYIKPSVSQEGLDKYEEWASKFGSSGV